MARAPLAVAAILAVLACSEHRPDSRSPETAATTSRSFGAAPSRKDTLAGPEVGARDGEWPMASGDFANTRYSGLGEITADNVGRLEVSWTFSTGVLRGQEAAPIVAGRTMYVVTPFPNVLHALDLDNPGSTRWSYEPKPVSAAQGVACCDVVNRGAAYADGRVFFNTLDNHTVAVDAQTGKEIWRARLGRSMNIGHR